MNYPNVKKELSSYNAIEVNIYINYLKSIENAKDRSTKEPKNKWFIYFSDEQAVLLYKKVALDKLFIDGKTITLQNKGSVIVNYNYQAYKNKLLSIYPETLFDIQNVYQGDVFSFKKESGKVKYNHTISNPFDNNKQIIGCYCIIKNKRGDFIETLNMDEINKMKNVAKTKNIWESWFGEMTLKSVIKRSCKRHFNDITTNIETLDNENYDLELVSTPFDLQKEIDDCGTLDELEIVYKDNLGKVKDEPLFLRLLGDKKTEIKSK